MVSSTDGWAVGGAGVILHWDGFTWSTVASPTTAALRSVDMLSATDGWAVGFYHPSGSVILHWDGVAWTNIPSPTQKALWSIDMVSATDGWAVASQLEADGADILHWDGRTWSVVLTLHSPGADDKTSLSAIDMVSATDGWVAGGEYHENCGRGGCRWTPTGEVLLHWDGHTWTRAPGPYDWPLVSLSMLSATDGWVVSYSIRHWDGTAWNSVPSPVDLGQRPLNAVAMRSASDGWAVGSNGLILHWDGVAWTEVPSPIPTSLFAVSIVSEQEVWVSAYDSLLHYAPERVPWP